MQMSYSLSVGRPSINSLFDEQTFLYGRQQYSILNNKSASTGSFNPTSIRFSHHSDCGTESEYVRLEGMVNLFTDQEKPAHQTTVVDEPIPGMCLIGKAG